MALCAMGLSTLILERNLGYKEKGYYVGSGAIESGNKVVLQKRLKLAGMRWNELPAQYLLSLRAKYESGLWLESVVEKLLIHEFEH
jgi:hypothetical protein